MATCAHLQECEFVLDYVARAKPHWDDFVSLYCQGSFQDVCHRLAWFEKFGSKPPADLMPTGKRVPEILAAFLDQDVPPGNSPTETS